MKNVMKRLIIVLFAVLCINATVSATTTSAAAASASTPLPYGFTYSDVANGRTCFYYYKYDTSAKAYKAASMFYSKGNKMYRKNGQKVDDVYASSGQYAGFDITGRFYVVTPKLGLIRFTGATTRKVLLTSGCVRLAYNSDGLATAIVTNNGWRSLSTLTPVAPVDEDDDDTPATPLPKNRVQMYTNASGEMVYEALANNKVKLTLVVSKNGKNVLNKTYGVRLSDAVNGAKFVGLDKNYNVYLAEGSTLYRFKYGSWYSAQKVTLRGTYKSFKNDTAGFINKVVTTSGSYTIQQLEQTNWAASRTYAVRKVNGKNGYVTLYIKNKTVSYTLIKKGNCLYFKGKKIASNVTSAYYYGFTSKTDIWYLKGKTVYKATLSAPTKAKVFAKNVKKVFTSNGLLTKVQKTNGDYVVVK